MGYNYKDLYDLDMDELGNMVINRRKGLAYEMWKSMILNRYILATKVNEIPKNPEEACPELYPPKKSYEMPDFLKEKYLKQQSLKLK